MRHTEMFYYAVTSLKYRKIRSWLTILGILVGITSVVVLVGLGQGVKNFIGSQMQSFGPRTIIVAPYNIEGGSSAFFGGSGSANIKPTSGKLYEKDVERLKKIGEIDTISKIITGRSSISFKGEEITSSVYGVEPSVFAKAVTLEVEEGRFIEDADKGVALIGSDIAETVFKNKIDTGAVIYTGGQSYAVAGVLKKTGNSFMAADSAIFITFDEAKDLYSDQLADEEVSVLRIIVKEGYSISDVGAEIEQVLLSSHKLTADKKDFTVVTPEFINKQVEGVTGILTAFLGGIAAISLLIGGIGISNTMFMSVLERRREIGILKSVGASEYDIRHIFICEAGLVGVLGGLMGVVIGGLILSAINMLAGFPAAFSPEVALGAIGFSATVGIIAGYIPASQAARLDPIEALRYE